MFLYFACILQQYALPHRVLFFILLLSVFVCDLQEKNELNEGHGTKVQLNKIKIYNRRVLPLQIQLVCFRSIGVQHFDAISILFKLFFQLNFTLYNLFSHTESLSNEIFMATNKNPQTHLNGTQFSTYDDEIVKTNVDLNNKSKLKKNQQHKKK